LKKIISYLLVFAMLFTLAIPVFAINAGSVWSGIVAVSDVVGVYQTVFVFVVIIGATLKLDLVWNIADTLNGFMAIPNLIALLALSGVVIKLTKNFFDKEKLNK